MKKQFVHIIIVFFLSFCPVSFCFSTEETNDKSLLIMLDEAEDCLSQDNYLGAVYKIDLIDNELLSQHKVLAERYIGLLKVLSQRCYIEKMFSKSLELSYKGIDCCRSQGYTLPLGELYKTAGNVLSNFGEYDQASKYYNKSLYYARLTHNSEVEYKTLSNLVITSCIRGKKLEAHRYFDSMHQLLAPDSQNKVTVQPYIFLYTWAKIQKMEAQNDSAFYYFKLAYESAQKNHLPALYLTSCNYEMAMFFDSLEQYDSARYYYSTNLEIASLHNLPEERLNSYRALSRLAQLEGHIEQAYLYKEQYLSLSDSLFNVSELRKVEQNRYEYNEMSQRKQINRLNEANALKMNWIRMILLIVCALVVVLFLIYYQKRVLKDAYNNLYKCNRELLDFESLCYEQTRKIEELTQTLEQSRQKNEEVISEKESNIAMGGSFQPTEEQRRRIVNAIEECMRDVNIICNPEFSLEQLSVLTKYNYKYLSQIINETYHQNFRSFLSEFRIREAQRLLSNPSVSSNYTIQAIGERVGYRSQSTFISIFKKTTGLTPSQYQQLSLENIKRAHAQL